MPNPEMLSPDPTSYAAAAKAPPAEDSAVITNGVPKKISTVEQSVPEADQSDKHLSTIYPGSSAVSDSGFHSADLDEDDDGDASGSVYRWSQPSNGLQFTSLRRTQTETDEDQSWRKAEDKPYKTSDIVSGRVAGKGWDQSGIRFAPLNIPLKRRLQTLAILLHTISIPGILSLFFLASAIPIFWPLLLVYVVYVLLSDAHTNGRLTRRSNRLRSMPYWSLFASYYPARLHRTTELPPTRKYLFGYHPHGIISHGAFASIATEALGWSQLFPGITNSLATLDSNFRIPFYRDYALAMGLVSVSRTSVTNVLSRGGLDGHGMGRAITIVVGGARESLEARPGRMRLILHARKGFVKLAIRTGADLVPIVSFGENDLYDQVDLETHPRVMKVQMAIKRALGWTMPLFHARGIFNYDVGLLPYRRPVNVVVGRPILVQKNENPDQDEIERIHAEYVAELERLWGGCRELFAPNAEDLEIVG